MKIPKRKDCLHSPVCKFDDGMCPLECGHFIPNIDARKKVWIKNDELKNKTK